MFSLPRSNCKDSTCTSAPPLTTDFSPENKYFSPEEPIYTYTQTTLKHESYVNKCLCLC